MLSQLSITEPTFVVIVVLTSLVVVLHQYLKSTSRSSRFPPGPPVDSWIFGHSIPTCYAYRKFEEWTKIYGPVYSLRQGMTTIIVIGRYQAAVEIMEREGASLADRPRSIAAGETLSGGMRVLLTPMGERFKKMRKALHSHLQPKVVQTYAPVLMKNAKQLILDVIDNPDIHQEHSKRYAAAVVMALAYGKPTGGHNDPDVTAVIRCLVRLGITLRPGVWQVDFYPWLRYVPGYLHELQEGHREELNLFRRHLDDVRGKLARGEHTPQSFSKYLLSQKTSLGLSDDETAYLAGSMFGAGSDTTASAISVGVLAAACYPDAQSRVQEELDSIVGRERAPTFSDENELPQLNAFVLETFRWRPVTAGGFAHKATKDLVWHNFVIPKGATVIGNVWSVGRDPEIFPSPEQFNPQRWIDSNGKVRDDLKAYTFGFGRRVCPGQYMAHASVFLNTALIQWAFTIRKDPNHPIDEWAFTESANAHPKPFKVRFEPRVGGKGGKGTFDGVKDLLEEYDA